MADASIEPIARPLLQQIAGPGARFREGQLEAITSIVGERRRTLVVQRTGWGKSAVYLIATRMLRDKGAGPTVIVSPLIALMRNQLEMADRLSLRAHTVNSTNREEWVEISKSIARNEIDLLLISPERLNNPTFRDRDLPNLVRRLGLLVVDEVHCISDWGHDFRPDYRRLGRIVQGFPPGVPVLGTTATANDRVISDVEEQLGSDLEVIRGTLDRESLHLQVLSLPNKASRLAWLAGSVGDLPGSGIVYCLTIKDTLRVAAWLQANEVDAVAYTGSTDAEERLDIERRLSAGDVSVVVATSALGMGYDNPRIHYVIHYQSPGSPIAYYQQVGRAGRAVERAYGVLLTGSEDRDIQDHFIETAFPTEDETRSILAALASSDGLTIRELESTVNITRRRIDGALKVLEVEGALYREGSTWHRSASPWKYPADRVRAIAASRRREQAAMAEYVGTDACLMQFLRRQLDEPNPEPCGRCANCVTPTLATSVQPDLERRAVDFIRGIVHVLEPRRRWPFRVEESMRTPEPNQPGRVLTLWGDPGLARDVEMGKYRDGRFSDDLVSAAVALLGSWDPDPAPTWVTGVPGSTGIVQDFAERLAERLGLPHHEALEKTRRTKPQKTLQNSTLQARNVIGAFRAIHVEPGPVLLIDDMIDSRWTMTAAGHALRSAGAGPVYPLGLADTSRSSA